MMTLLLVLIFYFVSNLSLHLVCQLGLLEKPKVFTEKVGFVFGCIMLTGIFWALYTCLFHILVVLGIIFIFIFTLFSIYWLTLKLAVGIVAVLNKFKS